MDTTKSGNLNEGYSNEEIENMDLEQQQEEEEQQQQQQQQNENNNNNNGTVTPLEKVTFDIKTNDDEHYSINNNGDVNNMENGSLRKNSSPDSVFYSEKGIKKGKSESLSNYKYLARGVSIDTKLDRTFSTVNDTDETTSHLIKDITTLLLYMTYPNSEYSEEDVNIKFEHLIHDPNADENTEGIKQVLTITEKIVRRDIENGGKSNDGSYGSRLWRLIRKAWSVAGSYAGIMILLLIFTFLGAGLFMVIEDHTIEPVKNPFNFTKASEELKAKALQNENWKGLSMKELNVFLRDYEFLLQKENEEQSRKQPLGYWNWFLFCFTVYTTIGYGHISPSTNFGLVVCIIYSMLGIPLFLMAITKTGKLFVRILKTIIAGLRKCCCNFNCNEPPSLPKRRHKVFTITNPDDIEAKNDDTSSIDSYKVDDNFDLSPGVSIFIMVIYICFGAWIYMLSGADWNYLQSFYFVFISLSTIGFGDLIPNDSIFFILTIIYLAFGLAFVSMIISSLADYFDATIKAVEKDVAMVQISAGYVIKRKKDKRTKK